MANPFDQFDDTAPASAGSANPFDQFDAAKAPVSQSIIRTSPQSFAITDRTGKRTVFTAPTDAQDDDIRQLAVKASGSNAYRNAAINHDLPTPSDDSAARGFALGAVKPLDYIGTMLDKIPGVEAVDRALSPDGKSATDQHAAYLTALANNSRTGFQTLGNIAGVVPLGLIPGANTSVGLALGGAASGLLLGSGEGVEGAGRDASVGAATGFAGGKLLAPLASAVASAVGRGAKAVPGAVARLAQASAPDAAADVTAGASATPAVSSRTAPILLRALAAQGQTPEQAIAAVNAAKDRGVPLALMDTGDETRGLASSLARAPGESRTIMRGAVLPRQDAQLDRIQTAIGDNLGPVANVRAQSQSLIDQARTAAGPLYDKAYSSPPITSPQLEKLLATPAGQSALGRARTIAANEMRDPSAMGFVLDKDGNVSLDPSVTMGADGNLTQDAVRQRGYTPQTLDYVKRGLDDVVEDFRDPTTGKLNLDESGRAINGVRHQFVSEVDKLNPDYAEARKAYAGPAAMSAALKKGASIGNKDADTVGAEVANLGPSELDQYKLGVRSALSNMLAGRLDGADKVKALIGSPKKRAVLESLFGGGDQFGRFMATLGDEGQAAATYGRVNTGSQTAANLADDGNLGGLTGVAANAGERALRGHGLVHNAVSTLADLYRYGAGEAGKAARADLARTISSTDPNDLAAFQQATDALAKRKLGDIARVGTARYAVTPVANAGVSRLRQ